MHHLPCGEMYTLDVEPDEWIDNVMAKLKDLLDVPVDLQRLCFRYKKMTEDQRLSDHNIRADDMIFLFTDLRG